MDLPSWSPVLRSQSPLPINYEALFNLPLDDWATSEWAPTVCPDSTLREDGNLLQINLEQYSCTDDAPAASWDETIQSCTGIIPGIDARVSSTFLVAPANPSVLDASTVSDFPGACIMTPDSSPLYYNVSRHPSSPMITPPGFSARPVENYAFDARSEIRVGFDLGNGNNTPKCYHVLNYEYLVQLSPDVLKELSASVSHALGAAETRESQKSRRAEKEPAPDLLETPVVETAARLPKSFRAIYKCEQPGCTVTFQRMKDRQRHVRNKHQANEGFVCPIMDCPMGTGHRIQRSDKLRDHLRGKHCISSTWSCIIPGCFTEAGGRLEMLDHLGEHDYSSRLSNRGLLIDYGFAPSESRGLTPVFVSGASRNYPRHALGYITKAYICTVLGCPFGSNSIEDFRTHQSLPHENAHCPCPITGCGEFFRDWDATYAHVLRHHSKDSRKASEPNLDNQGFKSDLDIFVCPICKCEIKYCHPNRLENKARLHCQTHDYLDLLAARKELVGAWIFSAGCSPIDLPGLLLKRPTDLEIFAFLALSRQLPRRIRNREHWSQICSEIV